MSDQRVRNFSRHTQKSETSVICVCEIFELHMDHAVLPRYKTDVVRKRYFSCVYENARQLVIIVSNNRIL